uniref:Uncharacterized protein n=1 Tax=Cucumis melo TaxID=3656 RepID=A0A9I9CKU9_CUCME
MEAAAVVLQNESEKEKGFFFVDWQDVEETENSKLEEAFEAAMATGEYYEMLEELSSSGISPKLIHFQALAN